jgi:hypothetical protein
MNNTHIPKLVYEYTPTGRKNVGQPRKICRGATPTEDRTSLDGLYPVADDVVIDDDNDDDNDDNNDDGELGMCI